jgi:integrase/recombinase XerD
MKQAKVLSENDIRKVLESIKKRAYSDRNRCIFLLGMFTGMRIGEIAALKTNDVFDDNYNIKDEIVLSKEQTKGNSSRIVLLNTNAKNEIIRYHRVFPRKLRDPLFVSKSGKMFSPNSLCQVMGRIYNKSNISNATSHSMRRTFLTNLADKGISIHILAALAGHKNISTTMVYLNANINHMRSAIELI